jgi:uncharacterized Zn finger protein
MTIPDQLEVRRYDLPCPSCSKVSQKSFIQLETQPRLSCDHCGIAIRVSDYYSRAKLEDILKTLGRSGYILRERDRDR